MAITLADNLEKPKGYRTTAQYLGGVPTSAIIPPITVRPRPPPTRQHQQRGMSRTIWFALTGAFFAELPAVICASPENRAAAIGRMIANMSLAAAGAGATVLVVEAIKRALQGPCKDIVSKAVSNLGVSTLPIYHCPSQLTSAILFWSPLCPKNRAMQHAALQASPPAPSSQTPSCPSGTSSAPPSLKRPKPLNTR
jgi:hypothetical protein